MERTHYTQFSNDLMLKEELAAMVETQKTNYAQLKNIFDIWVKPSHILNYSLDTESGVLMVEMNVEGMAHKIGFELNEDMRHRVLRNL